MIRELCWTIRAHRRIDRAFPRRFVLVTTVELRKPSCGEPLAEIVHANWQPSVMSSDDGGDSIVPNRVEQRSQSVQNLNRIDDTESALLVVGTVAYIWAASSLPDASIAGYLRWAIVAALAMRTLGTLLARHSISRLPPAMFVLSIFCIYALASAFMSSDAVVSVIRSSVFGIMILVTAIRCAWLDNIVLQKWIRWLGYINLGSVCIAWMQIFSGAGHPYVGAGLAAFMGNPNDFGSLMAFTFGPAVFLAAQRPPHSSLGRRVCYWAVAASDCIFVVMTHSRTSIVALVFGACAILALVPPNSRRRVIAAIGIGVTATAVIIGTKLTAGIYQLTYKGGVPNLLSSRVQSLSVTYQSFRKSPIIGSGFGVLSTPGGTGMQGHLSQLFHSAGIEQSNSMLGIGADLGVLGISLMLLALVLIAQSALQLRSLVRMHALPSEVRATIALVVVGMVHMNGEAWLVAPGAYQAWIFWVGCGFLCGSAVRSRSRSHRVVSTGSGR